METTKPRVVLADDEDHIRLLMKTMLTSKGYEVLGVGTNGEEAVTLYREKRPDLLLLDINMPFKTGEEALREIMRESPDALVIMLTSVSDLESVKKCLSLGARNFIRKDTPISEIEALIMETFLRDREDADA